MPGRNSTLEIQFAHETDEAVLQSCKDLTVSTNLNCYEAAACLACLVAAAQVKWPARKLGI